MRTAPSFCCLSVSNSKASSTAAVVTVSGKIVTDVETSILSLFSCMPSLSTVRKINGDDPLCCGKSSSFSKTFDDKIPESSIAALLRRTYIAIYIKNTIDEFNKEDNT